MSKIARLRTWGRPSGSGLPARPSARRRGARYRHLIRIAVLATLFVLIATAAGMLWRLDYSARATAWTEAALDRAVGELGLRVTRITISGRVAAHAADVEAALGIARGDAILATDLARARANLEALGWIETATVSRRLPDTIEVRLIERRPLALWQNAGTLALISGDGSVITRDRLGRYAKLALVVGPDAARHAAALLDMMATEPALQARVRAAVRVGGRRWNLRLDGAIEVRLPERAVAAAWHRLAVLEREHAILERDLTTIDLRLPDRLIVRLTPAAAEARKPGETT